MRVWMIGARVRVTDAARLTSVSSKSLTVVPSSMIARALDRAGAAEQRLDQARLPGPGMADSTTSDLIGRRCPAGSAPPAHCCVLP